MGKKFPLRISSKSLLNLSVMALEEFDNEVEFIVFL